MDYRPVKTVPYFPAKIISTVEMLYSFEWMKTEVFKPILSQCWIQVNAHVPSKIVPFFFCANEQNGFKNSTCKRLFWRRRKESKNAGTRSRSLCLKAIRRRNWKTISQLPSLLHRFFAKFFGIPRKHNSMNTYLKQIRDISAKISAKFSLDAIFVEKYGPLTVLIS